MGTSYVRQSTMADGDTITAALFNDEFNRLLTAFSYASSSTTGHQHDGTAAEGGNIHTIGDQDFLNKIVADSTNNRWGFFVEVSSSAVEQIRIQDGAIVPVTDNDIDLGTSSLEFKDAYFDGTVTTDALVADTADINGGTVDGATIGASSATTIVGTTITANTAFVPDASDGAALGTSALEFSDLYLADGAVIYLGDDQDVSLTHVADTGLLLSSTDQLQFGDSGTYIHQSADGVLDLVADTEIEINATTIDINGAVDVSGNLGVGGNLTVTGTTTLNGGTLTLGDAATDNVVFGADVNSSVIPNTDDTYDLGSASQQWRNVYVDGTAYVDVIDLAGTAITSTAAELNILDGVTSTAAELNILDGVTSTAAELNALDGITAVVGELNALDIGVTAVGTAVASKAVILDSNKDYTGLRNFTVTGELDAATLDISGNADIDGTTNLDAVDIDGAVQIDNTVTVGVDDTGYDVKFFGATASAYMLWDESVDDLILAGAARVVVPDSGLVLGSTAVTSTAAELNILDGVTSTAAELNILDGKSFLDEDTLSSNSATGIASQQSIKAYVDSEVGSASGTMSSFILEDGDGTEVSISDAEEVKFIGSGITINWTDITPGSDVDPFDLTFTVDAAQSNITSLGTLTALTVDDLAMDGKVITMTGSASDTAVFTAGTNGTLSIVTTDAAAAAANIQITADGTVDIDSAGVLTLDSGAAINIEPAVGSAILLDGTISIDAGVVTGATSITSTDFVGALTGNVTGNASGTALTVTQAAQSAITSLGTLTTLTVDNVIINGSTIGHTGDTDLMTVASGVLTVAGEVSMTTLDIGGTNVTSTAAELNILDGVTSTAAELNILDGVTSTAAELNILDGVTSTAAELNILDGVTSTAAELNLVDGAGTLKEVGKESIWIPAGSMYPSTTNPCSDLEQVETTALRPDLKVLDFDPSSDEFAQFSIAFPKSWNEGTVTFQPFWTVTGTNAGTVAWQLGGIAVSNDDTINTAFGTLVATTALAHSGTSNDLMVSAESGAVTIAGSPAAGDCCFFQINRDVSADAQTGDARLLGIKLFFTTDAANDA